MPGHSFTKIPWERRDLCISSHGALRFYNPMGNIIAFEIKIPLLTQTIKKVGNKGFSEPLAFIRKF